VVLVFDIFSDMAMFRKSYTTTSQVSYAFSPPTAVAGLVAALVGIDHQAGHGCRQAAYWDQLSGARIAIGLKNPVRWLSTAVNLIKFKTPNGNMGEHIQSKHQLVKKPAYRIYISGGEIYTKLKYRLERNEFVFTPYLGAAYALADVVYIGEYPEIIINEDHTWVNTIVPLYNGVKLDVKKSKEIHRELVPFQMNSERELINTVSVVYPEIKKDLPCGTIGNAYSGLACIWLKEKGELKVSQVGEERVSWFARW